MTIGMTDKQRKGRLAAMKVGRLRPETCEEKRISRGQSRPLWCGNCFFCEEKKAQQSPPLPTGERASE